MELETGYLALFFASFLAATVVPFSSELILSAMLLGGFNPVTSLLVATTGNWLGGLSSYLLGRMGKLAWIHKYLGVKEARLQKVQKAIESKTLWVSLFCWLPVVGDVMAVALGLLKANIWLTSTGMLIGKALRYAIWGYFTLKTMGLVTNI